jgi:predicted nucleic acid-binding protein
MEKRILDTSMLLRQWHRCRQRPLIEYTPADARAWADQLIGIHRTNAIVTPVYVKMVAGVTSEHELRLTRAYLQPFRCVDGGHIPKEDWEEAIRLAQRVPSHAKPRQLGDCLIRAIARRLKYRVRTYDQDFPV